MAVKREFANESQLTKFIVEQVAAEFPSAWILKTHGNGYQRTGIPDLLICHRGKLHGFEVKHRKPGESLEHLLSRVTKLQQKELKDIRNADGAAEVVWDAEQVLTVLRQTPTY